MCKISFCWKSIESSCMKRWPDERKNERLRGWTDVCRRAALALQSWDYLELLKLSSLIPVSLTDPPSMHCCSLRSHQIYFSPSVSLPSVTVTGAKRLGAKDREGPQCFADVAPFLIAVHKLEKRFTAGWPQRVLHQSKVTISTLCAVIHRKQKDW